MLLVRIVFAVLTLLNWLDWCDPIADMRALLLRRDLLVGGHLDGNGNGDGDGDGYGYGYGNGVRARYIYSQQDALVYWRHVKAHVHAARAAGWIVDELLFDDSMHCAHYLKDPVRYERAVADMWQATGSVDRLS